MIPAERSYLSVRHQLDRHTIGEIEAALNRARENQWPDLVSKGLMVLAQHLRWKQRFDQSLPHIQEALEVLQAASLPTLEVEREYADLLAYADRHEEAMEAYLICMKTYRALKDDAGIAWCHYGIGYIEQQWGNQTEALKHLQKAADWYRSVGDLSQAAAVDNSISDCLFMLGRYEEARAIAESASRQYNREGRHIPEAYATVDRCGISSWRKRRYATLVARYGHDASHYWGVLAGLAALNTTGRSGTTLCRASPRGRGTASSTSRIRSAPCSNARRLLGTSDARPSSRKPNGSTGQ
ncbi:MAG: tetratricopeptide repeat protein [bacterium]